MDLGRETLIKGYFSLELSWVRPSRIVLGLLENHFLMWCCWQWYSEEICSRPDLTEPNWRDSSLLQCSVIPDDTDLHLSVFPWVWSYSASAVGLVSITLFPHEPFCSLFSSLYAHEAKLAHRELTKLINFVSSLFTVFRSWSVLALASFLPLVIVTGHWKLHWGERSSKDKKSCKSNFNSCKLGSEASDEDCC